MSAWRTDGGAVISAWKTNKTVQDTAWHVWKGEYPEGDTGEAAQVGEVGTGQSAGMV